MIALMVISGLGGWFLYYAFLDGIATGKFKSEYLDWSRCVGAGGLMLSISAHLVINVFVMETGDWLYLYLWPVFMLALDPGYRIAKMHAEAMGIKASNGKNDTDGARSE